MGSNCEGFKISHFDLTERKIHFLWPVMSYSKQFCPHQIYVRKREGFREGKVKRRDEKEEEGNGKKEEEEE